MLACFLVAFYIGGFVLPFCFSYFSWGLLANQPTNPRLFGDVSARTLLYFT